jgi:hypothetical protein
MNLTKGLESAELVFKQNLEEFFVSVYDEKNLFSHGIDHHRRVWSYAKDLLRYPLRQYKGKPVCHPHELIIACYLHDIGMVIEPGPKHGIHSKELCKQFLKKFNLPEKDYKNVLDTIEFHDGKEYKFEKGRNDLFTVLSVADDLDAFGFIGIYRYSEIYLIRGISPHQIGYLILENAERRFANFDKIFGAQNNYLPDHLKRYEILKNFFIKYNKQETSYNFITAGPEEYCGVIQFIIMMIKKKMSLSEFFTEAEKYHDDVVIGQFMDGLKSELLINSQITIG